MKQQIQHHRGTTMHELLVAIALLGSIVSLVIPLSVKVTRVRQLYHERMVAIEEVANQMEQLALVSPDQIEHALAAVSISTAAADYLHEAELKATTEQAELGVRLRVSLRWKDRLGNRSRPVSLTTWLFPDAPQNTGGSGP
jgi:type II secretory pathway pseudopilin PulG